METKTSHILHLTLSELTTYRTCRMCVQSTSQNSIRVFNTNFYAQCVARECDCPLVSNVTRKVQPLVQSIFIFVLPLISADRMQDSRTSEKQKQIKKRADSEGNDNELPYNTATPGRKSQRMFTGFENLKNNALPRKTKTRNLNAIYIPVTKLSLLAPSTLTIGFRYFCRETALN